MKVPKGGEYSGGFLALRLHPTRADRETNRRTPDPFTASSYHLAVTGCPGLPQTVGCRSKPEPQRQQEDRDTLVVRL